MSEREIGFGLRSYRLFVAEPGILASWRVSVMTYICLPQLNIKTTMECLPGAGHPALSRRNEDGN